ncbi:MAG: hypothetical protein GC201_13340 [Alphaproteobacteria bacterium]|nr:hypothetical protein [Alphaproteobacteria bacterium]
MYIQIAVMERDIHDRLRGREWPAERAADDAGPGLSAPSRKARRHSADDYTVIVDLPDPLPITEAEIELLESELADFIAELLKK